MRKRDGCKPLLTILASSLTVLVISFLNYDSYKMFLAQPIDIPMTMHLIFILNVIATIVSISHIKMNKQSKAWYFIIIIFSTIGNIVYSITQSIKLIRKGSVHNARSSKFN